ncbi:MAG: sodium:alanine symporter family protein [Tissierellia bacterium]|nr:sodium:alanine symporter family protein [Tissierellia bacterium]
MNTIIKINDFLNGIIWGVPMQVLLLGTGLILAIKSALYVYRRFGYILKQTYGKMFHKTEIEEGKISPFQAVSTALAATIGTGNIVGVTLAITSGGPGAVFWMWIAALFGMTTKVAEVTLAVATRRTNSKGETVGGPMQYIEYGLGSKWLAKAFAFFGMLACFGIGCMTQSNSITEAINSKIAIPKWTIGILLMLLSAFVIVGGIKRIGTFAEKVVPFMAAFYILGGLYIMFINRSEIGNVLSMIFSNAFNGTAATGGFLGASVASAMKFGIARGVFSNEAGLGSAPIAHATSHTDHPVRQGLWGAFEVFNTTIVCTITAFVVLVSGLWTNSELQGVAVTSAAFETGFRGGSYIVTIGLVLFAFTTIIGWSYYGEKCVEYLLGEKKIMPYRILFIIAIFVGSIGGLKIIWDLADTLNGMMAIPNLIGLIGLSVPFSKLVKDFFKDPDHIYTNDNYDEYFEKDNLR